MLRADFILPNAYSQTSFSSTAHALQLLRALHTVASQFDF